jgi:hypothetical protein
MLFTESGPVVNASERDHVSAVCAPLAMNVTGGTNAPVQGAHDIGDVKEPLFNQGGNQ